MILAPSNKRRPCDCLRLDEIVLDPHKLTRWSKYAAFFMWTYRCYRKVEKRGNPQVEFAPAPQIDFPMIQTNIGDIAA